MTGFDFAAHYSGVPVTVLGASGFIGRWVARRLSAARADLHLVVRQGVAANRVFPPYGVHGRIHECDLTDLVALQELLGAIRPAIVFNLAGYGVDPEERDEFLADQINRALVVAVGERLLNLPQPEWRGQRLVNAGSALEYGAIQGDLRESSHPNPTTAYGRSKLAGTMSLQDLGRRHGLSCVTARLFTVYGPGEHHRRLLPSLYRLSLEGGHLPLTEGTQQRDFTYVEDVAEGILRLGVAHPEPGEPVNLATGILMSVKDFALTVARVLHVPQQQLGFGMQVTRPEEMDHLTVNVNRLRALVGWTPSTPVEEGVHRTRACVESPDGPDDWPKPDSSH